MLNRTKIFAAAGAFAAGALVCGAAIAAPPFTYVAQPLTQPVASVSGDYSYLDANQGGGHINNWGLNGSVAAPFASHFGAQVDAGYHNLSGSGENVNNWTVDGALFWQGGMGRIGATVGYNDSRVSSFDLSATNYGAYAQWYASDYFTLSAKGGGATLNAHAGGLGGHESLGYAGGQVMAYPIPNGALSGSIDWAGGSGISSTNYTAKGEYLFSKELPLSVFASYTYGETGIGGSHFNTNTFDVGLKFYFGANGAPLVALHRAGLDAWSTAPTALSFLGAF